MRAMNHDVMLEPHARQSREGGEGGNEGEGCDERLVEHVGIAVGSIEKDWLAQPGRDKLIYSTEKHSD
jgi:hypothetical protein